MEKNTLMLLIQIAESEELQKAWHENASAVAIKHGIDAKQLEMICSMKWGSSAVAGPGSPA